MSNDDLERQYTEAVAGVGVFSLERWTTVRVTGADRAAFLHNMCTNDVRRLAAGDGCEAFFTDVKGKILAHTLVLAGSESIQLVTVPGQAEALVKHLDRYVIREDVQLEDATSSSSWLLLLGRKAEEALSRLDVSTAELRGPWSHGQTAMGEASVGVVRGGPAFGDCWLLGTASTVAAELVERLRQVGAVDCPEHVWHATRIEAGWPLYGVDFNATNLPQEVGRDDQAISFRKGCYLGQETIARIDALGHVNRRLAMVRFTGDDVPPAGGELVHGDQVVGAVTSACWSPRFSGALALAMVRRGFNSPGVKLRCEDNQGEVIAGGAA